MDLDGLVKKKPSSRSRQGWPQQPPPPSASRTLAAAAAAQEVETSGANANETDLICAIICMTHILQRRKAAAALVSVQNLICPPPSRWLRERTNAISLLYTKAKQTKSSQRRKRFNGEGAEHSGSELERIQGPYFGADSLTQ